MLQFSANPSQEHLDKAMYICEYLAGKSRYALIYNGHSQKGLMQTLTGQLIKPPDGQSLAISLRLPMISSAGDHKNRKL
jgi:hypothetical protein